MSCKASSTIDILTGKRLAIFYRRFGRRGHLPAHPWPADTRGRDFYAGCAPAVPGVTTDHRRWVATHCLFSILVEVQQPPPSAVSITRLAR